LHVSTPATVCDARHRRTKVNTCQFCGAHFTPTRKFQIYCGVDCNNYAHKVRSGKKTKEQAMALKKARVSGRTCLNCGKTFSVWRRTRGSKYCSDDCLQHASTVRRVHLLNRYNLTPEDYDRMLKRQNGVCFLCKAKPVGRRLAVDHDHATGRVRGLLCTGCNVKLGWYEARRELIAEYLRGR